MTDQKHNYRLRELDEAYAMAQTLAHFFPDPDRFMIRICELLLNAVEHGNLGIGFEMKADLVRQGKWHEEIARRLALPENAEKHVEIELTRDYIECKLVIADQGRGFPWQDYIGRQVNVRFLNGRGLWIACNTPFDSVTFNPAGNVVTCVAQREHPPSAAQSI